MRAKQPWGIAWRRRAGLIIVWSSLLVPPLAAAPPALAAGENDAQATEPAPVDAAAPAAATPQMQAPDQEQAGCPVPPQPGWSEAEKWVWGELCRGNLANLGAHYNEPGLMTGDVDKWNPQRRLSPAFLTRIMTDPAYVAAIPFTGIRIDGAHFTEQVYLSDVEFNKPLQIINSVFDGQVFMEGFRTRSWISLYGSWFAFHAAPDAGPDAPNVAFSMSGTEIGQGLNLALVFINGDVNLIDLKVEENLWVNDATFLSNLWMDRAHFGILFANKVKVGRTWILDGAEVERNILISDLTISRDLDNGQPEYGTLSATQIHVRGLFQIGISDYQIRMPRILGVTALPAPPASPADQPTSQPAEATPESTPATGPESGAANLPAANLPAAGETQPPLPTGDLAAGSLAADGGAATPAPERPHSVTLRKINLNGVRIDGELRMRRVSAWDSITLEDAVIGDDLWLTESDVGYAGLSAVSVGGFVLLQQSRIGNSLLLDSGSVGRSVVLDDGTQVTGSFGLPGTTVKGSVYFTGAEIDGVTNLNSAAIERDLILGGGRFSGPIDGTFARIGGSLDLTGGQFASVDLTGARIAAELRLAAAGTVPQFARTAELTLRNATTNSLQDVVEAWPCVLHLEGFTYQRQIRSERHGARAKGDPCGADGAAADSGAGAATGADPDPSADEDDDRAAELIGWLSHQQPFSPQPYAQLAGILRQSGDNETAKAVLFAGKEREWSAAQGWSKFWLSLQFLFTGFGVHPQVAGLWVLALIAGGAWAFSRDPSPELRKFSWVQRVIYSFDMLLPAVHLRHHHYEIELQSWPRYYLYFHKIMGYVLLTFLAAALIGGGGFE